MELKILTDKEINEEVAREIVELINKKPNAVLGLATGGSPVGVYKELIKKYNEKEVSFKFVKTYNLDEYIGLTKDNKESYYYFMCHNLFNYIDINMDNVHLPDGINYEDSIANYENSIASDGGIDYQILGIGSNGHIAFNEPGTSFESNVHRVELKESTRIDNSRFFNSLDEVPTSAITMGLKSILSAKRIILIATGVHKAEAIKHLFEGKEDINWPVTILNRHENVTIFCDKESASLLLEEIKL